MAGIYIHIPFCRKRCTYCDFYTQIAPKLVPSFVDAALKEIEYRKDYLGNEIIDTIYFGGGTPSIITQSDFERYFKNISSFHTISTDAEITFEANPDDLSIEYLEGIRKLPFNRISIGIQSLIDRDLKKVNRRHTGQQAIQAVQNAKSAGFENISIDLIYGLPNQTIDEWKSNLLQAFELDVQHISIYGLTYEEGTKLWVERKQGISPNLDDETMNEMYLITIDEMSKHGYDRYEISNFCKNGLQSKHNSSYWKGEKYLGIGPSAHSYDEKSRQWNISNTEEYVKAMQKMDKFFEVEVLTTDNMYNDYVMVSLRTANGANLNKIQNEFGPKYASHFLKSIENHIKNGLVIEENDIYTLSINGIMVSNSVLVDAMMA